MLPTPDPFHVRRCPTDYVCFVPIVGDEVHVTPEDAIRFGERLIAAACEVLLSREAKTKEKPHGLR